MMENHGELKLKLQFIIASGKETDVWHKTHDLCISSKVASTCNASYRSVDIVKALRL